MQSFGIPQRLRQVFTQVRQLLRGQVSQHRAHSVPFHRDPDVVHFSSIPSVSSIGSPSSRRVRVSVLSLGSIPCVCSASTAPVSKATPRTLLQSVALVPIVAEGGLQLSFKRNLAALKLKWSVDLHHKSSDVVLSFQHGDLLADLTQNLVELG